VDNYIKSHPRYANMPRDTVRAMLQSYFAAQQQ